MGVLGVAYVTQEPSLYTALGNTKAKTKFMWKNMKVTNVARLGVFLVVNLYVQQKKQLATDFSAHDNLNVWLFVQLRQTSGRCRNGGKYARFKCRSSCFEVL